MGLFKKISRAWQCLKSGLSADREMRRRRSFERKLASPKGQEKLRQLLRYWGIRRGAMRLAYPNVIVEVDYETFRYVILRNQPPHVNFNWGLVRNGEQGRTYWLQLEPDVRVEARDVMPTDIAKNLVDWRNWYQELIFRNPYGDTACQDKPHCGEFQLKLSRDLKAPRTEKSRLA